MELGIFTKTYQTTDIEETFRRMKMHGLSHAQLNLANAGLPILPEEGVVTEEDLRRIREAADTYQISLDALTSTFNMVNPDNHALQDEIRQFRTQCQIAKSLGIPLVTLCTGSKNPASKWAWHEDNERPVAWMDLLETTERILPYAEEADVLLGVEPEASNVIGTAQKARDYLDSMASPRLKIIMDAANLFRPEDLPQMDRILEEAFDLLGKDIVSAHAKDFQVENGTLTFAAAGTGQLDYPLYLSLLQKTGYQGPLILHSLEESEVPASVSILQSFLT